MPAQETTHPQAFGNFKLVTSSFSNGVLPVHKYVSDKTGLTVIIGEIEGPLLNGYICLATEAHDDDGLPHTLEHLIFLGSEEYPYKGVLDLLANRCLASGTNAWTDTDHTCYTMTTASEEGFLSLLPIYIDHVFYPTLTDSAYTTEVHHINGEGRDGGVVFTEMQGVENTAEEIMSCHMLKLAYPGDCGYKSRTGGVMENLRTSTNNEKVKAYHKKFYRPENCFIIITGSTNPLNVLKALGPIEEKIIAKGERDEYERPWQSLVPALKETVEVDTKYPSDDESNGLVNVAWRGPSVVKDYYKFNALSILLKYLTDTPVSPLPKAFIDIPDPFCSRIGYSLTENSESVLNLMFMNVPMDKMNLIKSKLFELLEEFVKNADKHLEMKRLATVLHKSKLESMVSLEDSPHELIAFTVIGYMLYGNTPDDFAQRLNFVSQLEKMEKEPIEFWINLLKECFLDAKSITVKGIPSIEEQIRIAKEEEKRVAERMELYKKEGLEELEKTVEKAMDINNIHPPEDIFKIVEIPPIESVHFHPIKSYSSLSGQGDPRFDFEQVPLTTHLTDLHTNFIYMFVLMDSSKISPEIKPYLTLLISSFLQCPLKMGDTIIPYEEVIRQLEEDTVSSEIRIGVSSGRTFSCGPYPDTVCFLLQVEPKKYEKGIKWLKEILYNVEFTAERLKIVAMKLINDVPEYKRSGSKMVYDLMKGIMYGKDSNHYATNVLVQQNFLTKILSRLENDTENVLKEIKTVRDVLTNPENMTIHLAVNLDMLSTMYKNPASSWSDFLPTGTSSIRAPLNSAPEWKSIKNELKQSCVTGIGSVESTFMCLTSPCTADFHDVDLAPILVFVQYVSQFEGPMWRLIRGQGFAYSFYVTPRPSQGKLYLTFYRASNIVGAYKQAKSIFEERLTENAEWSQNLFECAKSSIIYETVQKEKSIGSVVGEALISIFKNASPDYNKTLVKQLSEVTIEDLIRIGPKYIAPMFDPKLSRAAVVCHPSKVKEISKNLNALGLDTQPYNSVEESFAVLW